MPTASSSKAIATGQSHARVFGGGGSGSSFELLLMLLRVSISKARSWADWKRSAGFFSRQCRTMRSSAGETLALISTKSGGSSLRMALRMSADESPLKARRPETISYSTAPKLNRSERASASLPRTCSGDM